jgi:EpsI family protein
MLRDSLRLTAALALLGTAAIGAFFLSRAGNPLPDSAPAVADNPGTPYLADVEGWYQITPQERAVTSRFDLSLSALPGSLPMQIGPWRGSTLPPSPDIAMWFDNPEVAIEREYVNAGGDVMWLALFGSSGNKSYHLFEHTPQTCYPGTGWNILRQDVDRIPIGNAAIYAQHGVAAKDGQQLIVLYWYMWDNFERDANRGVLSFRLTAPIMKDEATTLQVMKEGFLTQIFTHVLDWRRF